MLNSHSLVESTGLVGQKMNHFACNLTTHFNESASLFALVPCSVTKLSRNSTGCCLAQRGQVVGLRSDSDQPCTDIPAQSSPTKASNLAIFPGGLLVRGPGVPRSHEQPWVELEAESLRTAQCSQQQGRRNWAHAPLPLASCKSLAFLASDNP